MDWYWWVIGALGIIIVTLIAIYRRSLREGRALTHYLLAMTLHEAVYQSQRDNLAKFTMNIEAKDPFDLTSKVSLRTQQLVRRVEKMMIPVVLDRLWKLRTDELKLE
jgi:hypothetical protein